MEFILIIIILALVFDYINGFHDAANAIATIVSTKGLTPFQAVLWAAFFNMAAFFIFQDHAVANTIGKTVQKEFITLPVIFSGLVAAIIWNLLTWWYGIPSSSSHTLIGGFAGAGITYALMKNGMTPLSDIIDVGKVVKIVIFIFLAPIIGMVISMFYTIVMMNRYTWIKVGVLSLTCIGIWFLFLKSQEKKIDDNIATFFNVSKYEKDLHHAKKDVDKIKLEKKLENAQKITHQAFVYVKEYEKVGANTVATKIVENVDLSDVITSRIKAELMLFFKVEQLKVISQKDSTELPNYQIAQNAVDKLFPLAKLHSELGFDGMATEMMKVVPIQPNHIKSFKESVSIDIHKELEHQIKRGDNKVIRYGLIGVLVIIMLSFIYTEKIKEPSAMRTALNFKRLQLLSSALFSVGHGGNDAQKVMGIIAAALVANGSIVDIKSMPDWVPLSCYLAISIGTLSGGWKIVKTMGSKITKVTPLEGVCAETAGATTLFLTEQFGIPVSTTHTITGSIIGVGATKRLSAVRWGVTINLLWAWILTIPISALIAGFTYFVVSFFV